MSEQRVKRTPRTDSLVLLAIIATLVVPAIVTLTSVAEKRPIVEPVDQASPLGYTRSLSLFLLPGGIVFCWFVRNPRYPFARKAFWRTLALLIPTGFLLDYLRASAFFTFKNTGATLGWMVPVVGGKVPIEEFCFYAAGFFVTLLAYIWSDEFWFGAYGIASYSTESIGPRRALHFHWPSLAVGAGLIGLGILYKSQVSVVPGWIPGYYIFLVLVAILPSIALYPSVRDLVNWRAVSFTFFLMLLVAMFWEATLAVPYQWWDYQESQMLGIAVAAWSGLPIEAAILWLTVTYTTVIVYETVKLVLGSDEPPRKVLFLRNEAPIR